MLNLSKQSMQSIAILTECARARGHWILTSDAARAIGSSKDRAAQLVHRLSIHGLIETRRGRRGGIRLAGDAGAISLGDVLRVTETDLSIGLSYRDEAAPSPVLTATLESAVATFLVLVGRLTLTDLVFEQAGNGYVPASSDEAHICPFAVAARHGRLRCPISLQHLPAGPSSMPAQSIV